MTFLLTVTIISGFDFGGRVGVAFPVGGIARTTRSSPVIGAQAGYNWNRHRLAFGYSFLSFPGKQATGYELTIHELALLYNYELLHRPNWGIALTAGPGVGFITRRRETGRETGKSPDCHIGIMFSQHEGRSRVAAGVDNLLFIARRSVTYFPALYAEVSYAF